VFLSYVLSFIYVGIYWNNHHHLMHPVSKLPAARCGQSAPAVLAVADPIVTGWMGENHFSALPVLLRRGAVHVQRRLTMVLVRCLLETHNEALKAAVGSDRKGKISMLLSGRRGGLLRLAYAGLWRLRAGGGDLVPARPPHRIALQIMNTCC
jgi:uncharacterized membrane protein